MGRQSGWRAIVRVTLPLSLVLVVLSMVLLVWRIEQTMQHLAQERAIRTAAQLTRQVEQGFQLGLSLADQVNLSSVLQALDEDDLQAAWLQTSTGELVASLGPHAVQQAIRESWNAQLLAQHYYWQSPVDWVVRSTGSAVVVGSVLEDAAGQRAGVVWLVYDQKRLRSAVWLHLASLWPQVVLALVCLTTALTGLLWIWLRWTRRQVDIAQNFLAGDALPPQDSRWLERWYPRAVVGAGLAVTLLVLTLLAWQGREQSRALLLEQMHLSANNVLQAVSSQLMRALRLGIPVEALYGVETVFAQELLQAPEVTFIALEGSEGQPRILTMQADASPLEQQQAQQWWGGSALEVFHLQQQTLQLTEGVATATLEVGTPISRLEASARSMMLDLALSIVIGLVLVRELLGVGWSRSRLYSYWLFSREWLRLRSLLGTRRQTLSQSFSRSIDIGLDQVQHTLRRLRCGADAVHLSWNTVTRVRLVVFLTALSDELLRPFLTVFAAEAQPWDASLTPTTLAGLPVMTFMLALALAQPLGPMITRRIDPRWAMAACALLGAVLLVCTGWTRESSTLTLLRAASGLVYGLLTIMAQTMIVGVTQESSRARGLVEVSAAIVAAGVCGPALGGLLVERWGMPWTFGVAGVCLLVAFGVIVGMPKSLQAGVAQTPGMGGVRGLMAVLTNRKVLAVTWLTAVPARLAAVAILVVITPLYLQAEGETVIVSGRVLILYFLVFMAVAPWAARFSDQSGRRLSWIVWGGVVSVAACSALVWFGGVLGAALCCALLGLGQALMSAPQLAMVTEAFQAESAHTAGSGATPTQALATFRFIERIGSIAAPLVVSVAVLNLGMLGAVAVVGGILAIGTVLLAPLLGGGAGRVKQPVHDLVVSKGR